MSEYEGGPADPGTFFPERDHPTHEYANFFPSSGWVLVTFFPVKLSSCEVNACYRTSPGSGRIRASIKLEVIECPSHLLGTPIEAGTRSAFRRSYLDERKAAFGNS